MEIRIVSFTEEKAKQFIYQKEQKTKMKQIDSAAMNQYSPANPLDYAPAPICIVGSMDYEA